jgi:hypothetical protein
MNAVLEQCMSPKSVVRFWDNDMHKTTTAERGALGGGPL